jgi:hypothetical protein
MPQETLREVLFEFVPQGRFVKVTAIDPVSKTEVAVVGDRGSSPETLKRVAVNKLRFVLNRASGQSRTQRQEDNLY